MDSRIAWAGGIVLAVLILAFIVPFAIDAWRNKDEPNVDEVGATEEWATGELAVIVRETSFDRESPRTEEVDMEELHTRLALEDVEIAAKKGLKGILDSAVFKLTDDDEWAKVIANTSYKEK